MLKESSAASEIASLEYRTLLPPCKRISLMAQYLSTACRTQPSFVLGQRRVIGHIWCTMASSIIVLTKVAVHFPKQSVDVRHSVFLLWDAPPYPDFSSHSDTDHEEGRLLRRCRNPDGIAVLSEMYNKRHSASAEILMYSYAV